MLSNAWLKSAPLFRMMILKAFLLSGFALLSCSLVAPVSAGKTSYSYSSSSYSSAPRRTTSYKYETKPYSYSYSSPGYYSSSYSQQAKDQSMQSSLGSASSSQQASDQAAQSLAASAALPSYEQSYSAYSSGAQALPAVTYQMSSAQQPAVQPPPQARVSYAPAAQQQVVYQPAAQQQTVYLPAPQAQVVYAPSAQQQTYQVAEQAAQAQVVYAPAAQQQTYQAAEQAAQAQVVYAPAPQQQTVQVAAPAPQAQVVYAPAPQQQTVQVAAPAPQAQVVYAPAQQEQTVQVSRQAAPAKMVYAPAPQQQVVYAPAPQQQAVVQQQATKQYYMKYIPGGVSRKLSCAQKVECRWNPYQLPGKWVTVQVITPKPIVLPPPRPIVVTRPQPIVIPRPQPVVIPRPQPIVVPKPVAPVMICPQPVCQNNCPYVAPSAAQSCYSNECCQTAQVMPSPLVGGQACCYNQNTRSMQCTPAVALTNKRHTSQQDGGVTGSSRLQLLLQAWRDPNVTTLLTDLLIPLKVVLQDVMDVTLQAYTPEEREMIACHPKDAECVGNKVLSCVVELEESNVRVKALEAALNQSTSNVQQDDEYEHGDQDDDTESSYLSPPQTVQGSVGDDSASVAVYENEQALNEALSNDFGQVVEMRLLSFTACLLQSFQAGVVERKGSALLATKRCVRSYKYNWSQLRRCASGRGQHALLLNTSAPLQPVIVTVNEVMVSAPDESAGEELQLALCSALDRVGVTAVICDLILDKYQQQREDQVELAKEQSLNYNEEQTQNPQDTAQLQGKELQDQSQDQDQQVYDQHQPQDQGQWIQ